MRSNKIAQGFIQSGLENVQGCSCITVLCNLLQCLSVVMQKKVFPYVQSEPVLLHCARVISCPPATHHGAEPGSILINFPVGRLLLGPSAAVSFPG